VDFWGLIGLLGPELDLQPLQVALAARSGDEVSSFWDQLVGYAAALNTQQHRNQTPVDVGDDPADPLPVGDDAFLHVRIVVVAHGEQVYEAVLADPSRLSAVWPFELGEDLVAAVGEAFEESTGDPWPLLNPDVPAPSQLARLSRHQWFSILVLDRWRTGEGVNPGRPYDAHMSYLEHLLNEDRQRWDWWDQLRGEESCLSFEIDPKPVLQRRSTVREGRNVIGYDEVQVMVRLPEAEFAHPLTAESSELGWAMLARAHFDLMFVLLKDRLNIDPPANWVSSDTARIERQRKQWKAASRRREQTEANAEEAWQRYRSSEHIWRGRAPDKAVDELIAATRAGKRIVALPHMIATLRATHHIAVEPDDADRLAEAGYSPTEIILALGDGSQQ
jgi:hypothetical protein